MSADQQALAKLVNYWTDRANSAETGLVAVKQERDAAVRRAENAEAALDRLSIIAAKLFHADPAPLPSPEAP